MTSGSRHRDGGGRRPTRLARHQMFRAMHENRRAIGAERLASIAADCEIRTTGEAAQTLDGVQAQRFRLLTGRRLTTACGLAHSSVCSTPPRAPRDGGSSDNTDFRRVVTARPERLSSPTAASFLRRGSTIRKNIIGRTVAVAAMRFGRGVRFLSGGGTFVVLDQPARQHGRGVFLDPGIQQLRNFFPQIGGVAQPRKLVTLQGATRSGEQKVPRRLSPVTGQGFLPGSGSHGNTVVTTVNGTRGVTHCGKVWKFAVGNRAAAGKRGR